MQAVDGPPLLQGPLQVGQQAADFVHEGALAAQIDRPLPAVLAIGQAIVGAAAFRPPSPDQPSVGARRGLA